MDNKTESKKETGKKEEKVDTLVTRKMIKKNPEKYKDDKVGDILKEPKKEEKKSEVKPVDVKYRVTFLTNQMFKGLYRPSGTSAIVPYHVAEAYIGRTTLKFERLA